MLMRKNDMLYLGAPADAVATVMWIDPPVLPPRCRVNEAIERIRQVGLPDAGLNSYFVVSEDGTLLGYAEVRAVLDEGTLERIAVAPAARRRGIGEALLARLVREGRGRLAFLTLEVRAGNAPTIGLYEKLGFRAVGRRRNYYREEHEDALLMTITFYEETKGTQ